MWDALLEILGSSLSIGTAGERVFVGISMTAAGLFFLGLAGFLVTRADETNIVILGVSALLVVLAAICFWFVYRAISRRSE